MDSGAPPPIQAGVRGGTSEACASLIRRLRAHAKERSDAIAFATLADGQSPQATLTYEQLDRRARAIAVHLQNQGLAGGRVVLAYPPGLEFIAAYFGVLYAGGVAVPSCPPRRRTIGQFLALTADCRATLALSTADAISQFQAIGKVAAAVSWCATDQLGEADADRWVDCDPLPDALAMIQYTSGSTCRPKGVMLTHSNLLENTRAISEAFGIRSDSGGVSWLPAYHDMGLVGGVLVPMFNGITNILLAPSMFVRDPFQWLRAISVSRATSSGGPNFAYDLCVRRISASQRAELDLSSWSLAFVGAEPVQPDVLARFAEAFGPCGFRPASFYPCYGLAEATLMVTGPKAGAGAVVKAFDAEALGRGCAVPVPEIGADPSRLRPARRLVGCGEPVKALRVVIAHADAPVPAERVGEIWVSGSSVSQGYWGEPFTSATKFHGRLADSGEGPFLRTGDLGFLHEGQLFITGRVDDLIIVRGVNHHPQDLEATARASHPSLEAGLGVAFALGQAEQAGEVRLVLIHEIGRVGSEATDLAPILDAIRDSVLEEHGIALDSVVLVRRGTIAKTTSGKVRRRASREAFMSGTLKPLRSWSTQRRSVSGNGLVPAGFAAFAPPSTLFATVCQHALAISGAGLADVLPETPLAALGLDSLQQVELVAALERRFGRTLPDVVFSQSNTLGDLAAAVHHHLLVHPVSDATSGEILAEQFDVACFPEYLALKRHERMVLAVAEQNPYFRVDQGDISARPETNGLAHIDGRQLTNYCVYDYLGMSRDPVVTKEAKEAIDRYGTGAGASRLVSGEKQIHRDLEQGIAEFLGVPASVAFVSGHATNVTTIGHLMGPQDLVVHDMLAHNSILQGAKLSGATCRGFAHNDAGALDLLLAGIRRGFRRVLIAIEGVYSMDGDFPDLARFVEVKNRHRAMLLVDEAHSLGTMGATGRGIGEHAAIAREGVEFWMGTLSKSLASCGGYIAGSAALVEYLKYTAPGFVYSVGLSPPNAAAALAALTLLRQEPQRVARLQELSGLFLQLARERGLNTGLAGGTPVIPVIVGSSVKSLLLSRALFERGINVQPILHPADPERGTRLRFFITTHHTEANIRSAVDAVAEELARL